MVLKDKGKNTVEAEITAIPQSTQVFLGSFEELALDSFLLSQNNWN